MTTKIKRQKVKERVGTIDFSTLTGNFGDIIKRILELQLYYQETFPDAYEIWVEDNNWVDQFTGEFDVYIERWENDKEFDARVKKLMKTKNQTKQSKKNNKMLNIKLI